MIALYITKLDPVIYILFSLFHLQAYYVTGRGKALSVVPSTIEHLTTLLHACPASHLTSKRAGEIHSHILEKLVANLPADNLPRTLSLVHKIASSIGKLMVMEVTKTGLTL